MCGNENGIGDGGVQRFRNALETDYGFNWNPSQDVENDFVRQTLGRHHWLFHRLRHWFGYYVSKIVEDLCLFCGRERGNPTRVDAMAQITLTIY